MKTLNFSKYPIPNAEAYALRRSYLSPEIELNQLLSKEHWNDKNYDRVLLLASGLSEQKKEFREKVIHETLIKLSKSDLVQNDPRITPMVLISAYRRMNWEDGCSLDYYPLLTKASEETVRKHRIRLQRISHHKAKQIQRAKERKGIGVWVRD